MNKRDKLKVIIADRDSRYLSLLMNYVRNSEYGGMMSVRLFSDPDAFREHMRLDRPDVDLIAASTHFEPVDAAEEAVTVRLCESRREEETDGDSSTVGIYKYQPLHLLFGKMIELHRGKSRVRSEFVSRKGPHIYAVCSAGGGTGKTTVAVHMSRVAASKGLRCLYWNMELLPAVAAASMKEANIEHAARFVYELRNTKSGWNGAMPPVIVFRDERFGFDYFPGFIEPRESLELTRHDIGHLMEGWRRNKAYDVIVVDLESSIHDRTLGMLAGSDTIIWLLLEDRCSALKADRLLHALQYGETGHNRIAPERIRFVIQSGTGSAPNPEAMRLSSFAAAPKIDTLPYIAGWRVMHGTSPEAADPAYTDRIAKLLSADFRSPKGGVQVDDGFDSPPAAGADTGKRRFGEQSYG